jgi:hypothetical protein
MEYEEPSVNAEVVTVDVDGCVGGGQQETPQQKFKEKLKESVPEVLFCGTSCPKCYGRQYESIMADTQKPNLCTKLINRVNRQARIQAKLQSKLVDKVIKETDNG